MSRLATDAHNIPFFTSDQLPEYDDALLHTYGFWVQPERNGTWGRHPHPRLVPVDDLLYAQVVKIRENGRMKEVKTKIIFGKPDVIVLITRKVNTGALGISSLRHQKRGEKPKNSVKSLPLRLFRASELLLRHAFEEHRSSIG